MQVIDRIRHDIQQRLEQLLDEAEKLRHALAALDPRERSAAPAAKPPVAKRPVKRVSSPKASVTPKRTVSRSGAGGPARTAPGATRAKVLGALSHDQALTAGQVAQATGLARPTVSTTLSKLAKSGEVVKASRGYNLPDSTVAAVRAAEPQSEPADAEA